MRKDKFYKITLPTGLVIEFREPLFKEVETLKHQWKSKLAAKQIVLTDLVPAACIETINGQAPEEPDPIALLSTMVYRDVCAYTNFFNGMCMPPDLAKQIEEADYNSFFETGEINFQTKNNFETSDGKETVVVKKTAQKP